MIERQFLVSKYTFAALAAVHTHQLTISPNFIIFHLVCGVLADSPLQKLVEQPG